MAINKRTYPNNYFAYYNDDNRLAVLCQDTTSTTAERTVEKYDTSNDNSSDSNNHQDNHS